ILGASEAQVTASFGSGVPFGSNTTAVAVTVSFAAKVVRSIDTVIDGRGSGTTRTGVGVLDTVSATVAVISASPRATAVRVAVAAPGAVGNAVTMLASLE